MRNSMVGYLFAGQGSQYVGMGKDLYEFFPESKAVFDKADGLLGFSLSELCFAGPAEKLKQTIFSQPAILTVSIAAFEAFKSRLKIKPVYLAGLSLGEYSALIVAGSLSFQDGLRLVKRRAEIMEEASKENPGKMVVVLDLALDKVRDICQKTNAEIANLNAPGQIVISGRREAVDKAKELCVTGGAKRVIELEVSGGFHSSLMFEASQKLKKILEDITISSAQIPVISNYSALPQSQKSQIQENLIHQICSSVRWEESMRYMLAHGLARFFEFGPGKILKGLMRRIDEKAEVINIEKKEDIINLEDNQTKGEQYEAQR